MTYAVTLIIHIVAGTAGVLLGPVALHRATAGHVGRLAAGYHLAVLVVCLSAAALAVLDFRELWWFLLVAGFSYAFAARARLVARRRRPGWLARHLRGQGGAYIALWTALVVVGVKDMPALWLLPTAVGVPLIEWLAHRAAGDRPAGAPLLAHTPPGAG